jgi:uncharacterized membrane protein
VHVTARWRRARTRLQEDRSVLVVAVVAVLWFAVLALDVWRRHDRFDTFDNDLGFHTQFVWLLSRGHWFSTILGLSPFAHNSTFGYFLFVPLAWTGLPIPHVLDLTQALVIALGVVPVYRLARRRFDGWVTTVLPVVYLLHPVVQGNVWETFHPEAMAMTPLLAAYDAADEGRWRRFWVFAALAIVWKADVALFLTVLALVAVRRRDRRMGWWAFGIAGLWFVLTVAVMTPGLSGGGTVYGSLYGDLGDSPQSVVRGSISHPSQFVRHLRDGEPVVYYRDLAAPFGLVPALSPSSLLVGLPQNLISLLSTQDFTRDPIDNPHYQALPVIALTIGLIEGLAFVRRRRPRVLDPLVVVVLACALASSTAWGALPFGVKYAHYWSEDGDPLRRAKEHAVSMPAADDVVSAQYRLVPHLAERRMTYSFPNPWIQVFYGVEGTPRPDPSRVEWLLLDESVLRPDEVRLVRCIADAGTFDELYREGAIAVWRRNGSPPVDTTCGPVVSG